MSRIGRRIARTRVTESTEDIGPFFSLDDLFGIFIQAKEAEGLTKRTIQDHQKHYRYLRNWLNEAYPDMDAYDLTATTIREWINYMRNDKVAYAGHPFQPDEYVGLKPGTINIRLRSIKCFFKFLFDENYLKHNVTARVKLLRVEDDGIHAFNEQQVRLLLSAPDRRTYAGYRDYVLMLLLLETGMRISEVLNLKTDNVNFRDLTITIPAKHAKTRKTRTVPFSRKVGKELATLMAEVKSQFGYVDRIFISNYGEAFRDNYFRHRLNEYADKAHITGVRVSPHTFRHTFAKYYVMNGGDPFSLQQILGHADITMTRRYVQLFSEDLKKLKNRLSVFESIRRE